MKQRNSNILLWFAGVAVITAILLFLLLVHRSVLVARIHALLS
jgi:hypothetical protein